MGGGFGFARAADSQLRTHWLHDKDIRRMMSAVLQGLCQPRKNSRGPICKSFKTRKMEDGYRSRYQMTLW